jgi:hypothetical protein
MHGAVWSIYLQWRKVVTENENRVFKKSQPLPPTVLEELHNLYFLPINVRVIKSRMKWVRHVTCKQNLIGKPEETFVKMGG